MTEFKQMYVTSDGQMFPTMAEVNDYLRTPKVREALLAMTDNNVQLSEWLIEHREVVESAFDVGTITRVTKSDKAKLVKALGFLVEVAASDKRLAFLADNHEAIAESFRWPKVSRMTPEEKATAAFNTLQGVDGNEELANWVLSQKTAILEAYEAGKVKQTLNVKAAEGLAAYRAKKEAAKAAATAAEAPAE